MKKKIIIAHLKDLALPFIVFGIIILIGAIFWGWVVDNIQGTVMAVINFCNPVLHPWLIVLYVLWFIAVFPLDILHRKDKIK